MTRENASGSRQLEYEKAFEALEARAHRGELTLPQLRLEVQALRRRLLATPPLEHLADGADSG